MNLPLEHLLSTPVSSTLQNNTNNIRSNILDNGSHLLSELPLHTHNLLFGLNFKYTNVEKKGVISRLKGKTQPLDIDLSCILLDQNFNVVDTVWFKKLRDESEAIRHLGDSLDGRDRGDMAEFDRSFDVETIELRLPQLPSNINHIALIVSSYNGHSIKSVERGDMYISDDEGNEVYTTDLTLLNTNTSAIYVATLSRDFSEWRFTINNFPLESNKMVNMTEQVIKELAKV